MLKKFLIIGVLSSLILFSGCELFSSGTKTQEQKIQNNVNKIDQKIVEETKPADASKTVDTSPEKNVESQPSAEVPTTSPEVLLAKCLKEKGVKLYTSSTCSHCTRQKALFNEGVGFLPNIECLAIDGWSQECKNAGIDAVPSWIFANGEKLTGETALASLAEKSGCDYAPEAAAKTISG